MPIVNCVLPPIQAPQRAGVLSAINGNFLKNEVVYTPSTWEEWFKSSGVVGDITGLETTANGTSIISSQLSTNYKPGTKYGYLMAVVTNTITSGTLPRFDNTNVVLSLPWTINYGVTGNVKFIDISKASITSNKMVFAVYSGSLNGQKIKIKDIRAFELPPGSSIEYDFANLTADQLNEKYPF